MKTYCHFRTDDGYLDMQQYLSADHLQQTHIHELNKVCKRCLSVLQFKDEVEFNGPTPWILPVLLSNCGISFAQLYQVPRELCIKKDRYDIL